MKNHKFLIITLLAILAMSCEKAFFEAEPENNPEALFEDLWTTFDTGYAGFEERGVDWQAQYDFFRPQVTQNTSEEELADILKQLLATLDDGHVSLAIPDSKIFYSNYIVENKIDHGLFNLDLIKENYLDEAKTNGYDANTYGWINGEIGYVHYDYVSDNIPATDEILDYFKTAKGLIIDLRHNQGGDFTWAYEALNRFTDEDRYVHRSKTKNGEGPDDYTEWYDWYIRPSGEYFDKPLVLLTDKYTISAGERLTMAFKVLPNLTHLGDTTNGAFSTKIGKELANGWFYSVAPQKTEFIDGKSYEGPGLPPDIFVKNTAEEVALGQDKMLEAAINHF